VGARVCHSCLLRRCVAEVKFDPIATTLSVVWIIFLCGVLSVRPNEVCQNVANSSQANTVNKLAPISALGVAYPGGQFATAAS
jgi:hypothetical protein